MKLDVRNKILVLGTFLLLIASYQFAIKKTISLRQNYLSKKSELNLVKDIPRQLSILNQKKIHYDYLLQKMNLNDTSLQNGLLKITNTEALKNNTNVIYFNEPHSHTNDDGSFLTYNFQLEGKYNGLLRTIYPIENKGNFGEIVHINLEKKKDYRTNKSSLFGTVFFQQAK